jgi:hypothetical protein
VQSRRMIPIGRAYHFVTPLRAFAFSRNPTHPR